MYIHTCISLHKTCVFPFGDHDITSGWNHHPGPCGWPFFSALVKPMWKVHARADREDGKEVDALNECAQE